MRADFISINTGTTTATRANALKAAIQQLRQAQQSLAGELSQMNHMFDDSGQAPDFTMLELFYGLSAGKGQTVFDMLNGTMGAMNGTMQNNQAVNLVSQVG